MSNLLPPNATPLERRIAEACADAEALTVPIEAIKDPDLCPVELLPWLAWESSVDRWNPDWSEAAKRQAIKDSFFVHAHKGTIAALRRVVEPLGYLLKVVEWFETTPSGEPGTFALQVGVQNSGVSEAMYAELERLIDDAKPLSRHITGLSISMDVDAPLHVSAAAYLGDTLTIFPYSPSEIRVSGALLAQGASHLIDTLSIHPRGIS